MFSQKIFRTSAMVAALALSAPSTLAASDSQPVKLSGQEAAKGVTTVAIGAFNVGFIFKSVDQTKAVGGFMGLAEGTTRAESSLVGVSPAVMQQITDAAYADFVTQLRAKGYAVQDPAVTFAGGAADKMHPQKAPLDIKIQLEKKSNGKATFFKPTVLPAMLIMAGDFTGSGMSSIGLSMAAGQTSYALTQYAKTSGMAVIDVTYLIDFSDQKRPGSFSMGSLKINSGISVASNYSRVSMIAPSGKTAVIKLNQPIPVEGDFATMRDTTSGSAKAVETAGHVAGGIGRLMGGKLGGLGMFGRGGNTRKIEFDAKPENYAAGATKAASLANIQMVATLFSLR